MRANFAPGMDVNVISGYVQITCHGFMLETARLSYWSSSQAHMGAKRSARNKLFESDRLTPTAVLPMGLSMVPGVEIHMFKEAALVL